MSDQLLTPDQLAQRWQVPKSQVYRLTREEKIPVVKLGRYYRYRATAIAAYELGDGGPRTSDVQSVGNGAQTA